MTWNSKEYFKNRYEKSKEKLIAERAKLFEELGFENQVITELVKPKVCTICGNVFQAKTNAKYCCDECKAIAQGQQKANKPKVKSASTEAQKKAHKKYMQSEKGKIALKKYFESEKGKIARQKACRKASAKYLAKKRAMQPKIKLICPICNKEFTRSSEHRKYCSSECAEIGKEIRITQRNTKAKVQIKAETESKPRNKKVFIVKKNK